MPLLATDPTVPHSIMGQEQVVFLRPLVQSANIDVGEYTYLAAERGLVAR